MKIDAIFVHGVDGRYKPLHLAKQPLIDLKRYEYRAWNGRYLVSTGWGQYAGETLDEIEAFEFCEFMRDHMYFKAVVTGEYLPADVGTECYLLDENVMPNGSARLFDGRKDFLAGPGEWKFKILIG